MLLSTRRRRRRPASRSDQRRRVEGPIHGLLDSVAVRLVNVSFGGIRLLVVDDYDTAAYAAANWSIGNVVTLRIDRPRREPIEFSVVLLRLDWSRWDVVGRFVKITDEQYDVLDQLILYGRLKKHKAH